MVELNILNKRYWGKRALENISLCLPRGEIVGLFGENGAGKTTLMKCILGLLPFEGTVTLDGKPVTRKNIASFSFATSEHSHFSDQRFRSLMDFFSLPMHQTIRTFSTGQKNQFEVILALSQGADYILMDEPFAGNDLFNREDFYKVLSGILEPHETLLLSTHLIEEVSGFIGRAILLRRGTLAGDLSVDDLEESGKSLVDAIKEAYHYRADRVSRAIGELSGEEGEK